MQAGLDRSKANAELADAANAQQRTEFWNSNTTQRSQAVLDKVAQYESINAQFSSSERDVMDDIVSRGTLVDVGLRHDQLNNPTAESPSIREVAAKDLEAFRFLEGKPEQQAVAVQMGRMMESEQYSAYITENAPSDFTDSIEAAQVVSDRQQTLAPSHSAENDMEI
ncbi:hypothetical protein PS623_04572 [Pseudomonas fluorescens]|nr:hypothetical protein PS623_04572 [Pseudomonas fluorescens]